MLVLENVQAFYGKSHIIQGVSLSIPAGITCILGRNGAGKTTLLRTIMGYVEMSGRVTFGDRRVSGLPPHIIVKQGFGYVPQGRHIFPSLTVRENLAVAARSDMRRAWTLDRVFTLFPRLAERRQNLGFQLSGGEQQMLAIARALVGNPAIILLDEPSEGLAPRLIEDVVAVLRLLKDEGTTVLLVEQNLRTALSVANNYYVLSKGRISLEGLCTTLAADEELLRKHLAVSVNVSGGRKRARQDGSSPPSQR